MTKKQQREYNRKYYKLHAKEIQKKRLEWYRRKFTKDYRNGKKPSDFFD